MDEYDFSICEHHETRKDCPLCKYIKKKKSRIETLLEENE